MSENSNSREVHGFNFEDASLQKFLDDFHKLMVNEALIKGTARSSKVINFKQPEELKTLLDLAITDEAASHADLLKCCQNIIDYSVKTGSPHFFNQLYSGINAYGMAGSWLTDSLNTNIHTYEVSPAFIIIEKYLMQKICGILGFKNGDGIFCPGGSFSNIMSMNLARYKACPEFKTQGMHGLGRLKMYTSDDAHYSITKGAVFLGMGTDSVVKIPTDDRGKMIPEKLEEAILADKAKGEIPAYVNASCGTTVLGSYDPLNAIADVCDKYGLWMNVDACWGGGALLSDKYKHLMTGIERSKSVSWNFHKMSAAPIQCSVFLVSEKGLLEEVNSLRAEYLFQPDKCYDTSYDIGDKTVQCGKRVDSVKLWLLWKGQGDAGMGAVVDKAYDNAKYFTEKIKSRDGFRLVIPEFESTNICFWYIPPSLRGQEETQDWWQKVAKVAPAIKARMMTTGSTMIGYQPLSHKRLVNFFRIIIVNATCTHDDMDYVINEIERLGSDL